MLVNLRPEKTQHALFGIYEKKIFPFSPAGQHHSAYLHVGRYTAVGDSDKIIAGEA